MKTLRVYLSSSHISGKRRIHLQPNEVAVICLLKNGEYYISEFLRHHRDLGIKHFLFIDNGSTDRTIELLVDQPDISVIKNELPVRVYEIYLRSRIARWVFRGGWLLFVDSDELIEMPLGEGRKITEFVDYSIKNNYDVVIGQCLDLFPNKPLREVKKISYRESIDVFTKYYLSDINSFDYHEKTNALAWFLQGNVVSNKDIKIKYGGIRKKLFGENCCLTNHRFVKNSSKIIIYSHPHCCSNARCADFSLLVRHYKFAGDYIAREKRQIVNKIWTHGEGELRMQKMHDEDFSFPSSGILNYEGTSKLVKEGFLECSDKFIRAFDG